MIERSLPADASSLENVIQQLLGELGKAQEALDQVRKIEEAQEKHLQIFTSAGFMFNQSLVNTNDFNLTTVGDILDAYQVMSGVNITYPVKLLGFNNMPLSHFVARQNLMKKEDLDQ